MKIAAHVGALILAVIFFCASTGGVLAVFAQTVAPVSDAGTLTIPAGQKFIMRLETSLHTSITRKGDTVEFLTAADVVSDDKVAIANKSLIRGTVTKAKRAGQLFGRAEIRLRLDDIQLPDGSEFPLKATIIRVGFDPVDSQNGKEPKIQGEGGGTPGMVEIIASGAAQGALLGVICRNMRLAGYGAASGAAVSAAQIALQRGPDLDLPRSTMFEARFDGPMQIPVKPVQVQNLPPAASPVPEKVQVSAITGGQEQTAVPPEAKKNSESQQEIVSSADTPEASSPAESATNQPVLNGERSSAEIAATNLPANLPESSPVPLPGGSLVKTGADSQPLEVPASTIRVKVRMVQVDAVVKDRDGRMMGNLRADDFIVYEDGVQQEIMNFSQDKLPLSVALLVDRSGSVAPYISQLRRIAIRALNQLKPQDEVCLFAFADTVERLEDLTTDRRRIAEATDRIRAGGMTNITDALWEAINYLARNASDRRHAVILISDNAQTSEPLMNEAETIAAALETETVVYNLKTSGAQRPLAARLPSLLFKEDPVATITRETGGEIINVEQTAAFDAAFGAVISHLRKRYLLAYYSSGAEQGGVFHEIKVRLSARYGKPGSDYSVNAKRGYYATARSAASSTASNFQR
jgi:Ca-activated chloride channel homolog